MLIYYGSFALKFYAHIRELITAKVLITRQRVYFITCSHHHILFCLYHIHTVFFKPLDKGHWWNIIPGSLNSLPKQCVTCFWHVSCWWQVILKTICLLAIKYSWSLLIISLSVITRHVWISVHYQLLLLTLLPSLDNVIVMLGLVGRHGNTAFPYTSPSM